MPVSSPELDKELQTKLKKYAIDLTNAVQQTHVDGNVEIVGYLRNGLGAKIEITNLEQIENDDIDFWQNLAHDSGAQRVNFVADFGAGKITFDVEYKRPFQPSKYCEWLIYPLVLTILTASLKLV
jgi:hypothetical protein